MLFRLGKGMVFEMCIDALRMFENDLGLSIIKKNPHIITTVKDHINISDDVTKRILEDFISKSTI